MTTVTSIARTEAREIGRTVGTVVAMLTALIGIDLLFNAGLLARFYFEPGPAMLPARQLFVRIPFGYASFLMVLAFMFWFEKKTGIRGARAGARFGAIWGGVLGVAGSVGMFSFLPLGVDFLAGVAACQIVEYTVAGAIGGSGLGGTGIRKLYGAAIAVLILSIVAVAVLQSAGFSPAEHR